MDKDRQPGTWGEASLVPPEAKPSRWWRWPLGLAVVAVLGLGLAVLVPWLRHFAVTARGKAELTAILAEIDRVDPRWRWEHLEEDRPQVPDDENSVRILRDGAARDGWKLPSWSNLHGDDWIDRLYGPRPPNRRLDDKWLAFLHAPRVKRERAVTLAMSLSRYPRGRAEVDHDTSFDLRGSPSSDALRYRAVTTLLAQEHERLVHAGRVEEAAGSIRAELNAAAAFRDSPQWFQQRCRLDGRMAAVRRVERLLGMCAVPAETCRRLQAHLAAERAETPLVAAMRGERAAFHAFLVSLEEGQVSLTETIPRAIHFKTTPEEERAVARKYAPRLYEDHAAGLRILHRACALARLTPWELLNAWPACMNAVSDAKLEAMYQHRKLLTVSRLGGLSDVREYVRDQALLSCAVVALAVERFRVEQQRWPESLDELVPAFLDALPPDPYTGGSLQYTRDDEAVRISCVDRGGNDVAFQVWNTSRRGLAPLPPKPEPQPWMLK